MWKKLTNAVAAGAMIVAMQAPLASVQAQSSPAEARAYPTHHAAHRARVCRNRGTAIGVVAGALIGNSLGGHNRTTGTIVGAAAGGATGHAIAQSHCRQRYTQARYRHRR